MTGSELMRRLGLRPYVIANWRHGKRGQPTNKQLVAIARELKLPVNYLLDPTLETAPEPEYTDDEKYIIRIIRDLELPPAEVVRRIHDAPKPLTVNTPIADHRGNYGTPPVASGTRTKTKDSALR